MNDTISANENLPFAEVQPDISPVSLIPITFGAFNSQGRFAMTSTASAPPIHELVCYLCMFGAEMHTNTNCTHSKTTSIGSVRISTDQETTRESVVLEENLVNDARTRSPEANVVLGARCSQEIVDLLVDVHSACKILWSANLCFNQMVTVDSCRIRNGGHAGGHELENCHLSGRILACNAVGTELQVADPTFDLLAVRVVEVRIQDLFGIGERAIESRADNGEVFGHLLVVDEVALLLVVLADLPVQRRIADCGHSPNAQLGEALSLGYAQELSRQHGGGVEGEEDVCCGLEEERMESTR